MYEASSATCPRLLLLVPRGLTSEEIEKAQEQVAEAFTARLGVPQVSTADSKSWYTSHFESAGTWESWIWDTVCGKDFATRKPYFQGFVVIGSTVGRAGAGIVDLALRTGKAVLSYDGEHLSQVTGVTAPSDGEYGSWAVEARRIEVEA